jgi:outer membrane lipoprotein-sorting protein
MKRVISLLLVLVVVLGCVGLVACGGGGGGAVIDNGDSHPADGNGGGNGGGDGDGEELGDILGQGSGIDSVSYTMEISGPGMPSVTTRVWMEGNNFRTEMSEQGQTVVYLANYNTGKVYMYMPDMNMAYEINMGQVNPPDYEDIQDIPDYDYHIIGTENMDGKECLVVEYSYQGATVKSWIWKEHGFPVRVETTTPEGTTVIVYRNIDFGDIPDSMFELPPGVQIMEF